MIFGIMGSHNGWVFLFADRAVSLLVCTTRIVGAVAYSSTVFVADFCRSRLLVDVHLLAGRVINLLGDLTLMLFSLVTNVVLVELLMTP